MTIPAREANENGRMWLRNAKRREMPEYSFFDELNMLTEMTKRAASPECRNMIFGKVYDLQLDPEYLEHKAEYLAMLDSDAFSD